MSIQVKFRDCMTRERGQLFPLVEFEKLPGTFAVRFGPGKREYLEIGMSGWWRRRKVLRIDW